jgi:hypothetical protein
MMQVISSESSDRDATIDQLKATCIDMHQPALTSALNYIEKWWETSPMAETHVGFGSPCTMGQFSKMNTGCGWQNYAKIPQKVREQWGRKAVLTGKVEL